MARKHKRSTDIEFKTIIGKGDRFYGDIRGKGNIKLMGIVVGDIDIKGLVWLERDSFVEGNLNADDIVISGYIKGDVKARRRLEIYGCAKVYGQVSSKFLFIDEDVQGKFNIKRGSKKTVTFVERRAEFLPKKKVRND
ncbi:MAG: bactofilin family protein [bacterium]